MRLCAHKPRIRAGAQPIRRLDVRRARTRGKSVAGSGWARAKITLSGVGMRGKREGEKAGTGSAPVDEARKATGRTVSLGELHSAEWGSGMKNDRW